MRKALFYITKVQKPIKIIFPSNRPNMFFIFNYKYLDPYNLCILPKKIFI